MKKVFILLLFLLACMQGLQAQTPAKATFDDYKKRPAGEITSDLTSLGKFIDSPDKQNVADYYFGRIMYEFRKTASGTAIKDGKSLSTSASIDDKGAAVNIYLKPLSAKRLFTQFVVKGAAEEGFVSVFVDGKYKRTITGGLNFSYFPEKFLNKGFFTKIKPDHTKLVNDLIIIKDCDETGAISKQLGDLQLAFNNCAAQLCALNTTIISTPVSAADCNCFAEVTALAQPLIEKGLLAEDWITTACNNGNAIQIPPAALNSYLARKRLYLSDSIQAKAKWDSYHVMWLNGFVNLNEKTYPIFDASKPTEMYTEKFNNGFLTTGLGINYIYTRKRGRVAYNFLASATLKYAYIRDFQTTDLITLQKQSSYIINTDTFTNIGKQTQFYPKMAPNKDSFSVEVPLVLYFPKSKWGIDVGYKSQVSIGPRKDIFDDAEARFGVFIPVDTKDDNVITIEPLLRFIKLEEQGLNFLKDQLTFGFNVSVSIPKIVMN